MEFTNAQWYALPVFVAMPTTDATYSKGESQKNLTLRIPGRMMYGNYLQRLNNSALMAPYGLSSQNLCMRKI